ncbi:uncharacterized protein V6R79_025248 [Siganus canaliculatus]
MLGLLLLMALLCDANSTCPDDSNPLSLEPSSVTGELGKSFLVNCTSSEVDFHQMYWKIGNNDSGIEEEKEFVAGSVTLSDWSVKAECTIRLDETLTCSKDLPITVYKTPDSVSLSAPKYGPMVAGSDYVLSCDVINVVPVQHLEVKWYRDDDMVDTHIFNKTSMTPVNVTATLNLTAERNYNGAVFRCEAELPLGPGPGESQPILTAATSNYIAVVLYKPQIPDCPDHYTGVEDALTLDMLRCHADGNPPPTVEWYYQGEQMNASEPLIRTQSGMYTARFQNSYGYSTKFISITIKDCPLTLSPAKAVVRFGDPVSFKCSTTAPTYIKMGWETSSERVPYVTWSVESLAAWSMDLPCYVTLEDFTQCSKKPEITVYKTPDSVSLSAPKHGPMVAGSDYVLSCDVISVVPVQHLEVKWYRDDDMVDTHIFNKTSMTPVNVTATLNLTAERNYNGAVFRCEAELPLGPGPGESQPILTAATSNYIAVVLYKPQIPDCPDRYTGVEDALTLDMLPCHADGNPPPTVEWYYQGEQMNASEPLIRTQSGMYTARFHNNYGYSTTFVHVTVEYGPSFNCAAHYEVHEYGKPVCEPEGLPKPVTKWFKDGRETRTPLRWTKQDTGSYSLTASNTHGTASHKLYVNVLYIQMFREENYTQGVFLGGNVTFGCHAEGNPTPEVYWSYSPEANVMESTGGSQSNISVTGATSTNAGVYVCFATNRVGHVTKSVTLKINDFNDDNTLNIYGEQHGGKINSLIWLVPALLICALVAILLILFTRRKRQGNYNFVPQRDKEGADIPMTTTSDA